jgi:ABC-2 type transport system permease protein
VEDETVDAAVVLSESPTRVIAESADSDLVVLLQQAITVADLESALLATGLSGEEVAGVLASGDTVIDELDPVDEGRRATAAIASIVLYVLLLLLTSSVASGVAIEKANRVSEVLLAIVPSRHLLFGKVVGVALVGVVTLSAAALPVVIELVLGGSLPDGAGVTLAGSAAWLLLGIALYLTTAGALGALVDRQEEVGSTVAPLSAVLIAAYLVGVTAPESTVATVLAYIPFTSPMVMPARIALGVASPVELAISLALGIATVAVVARLASVVYQRAIVRTGQKVRLRSLLRSAA